MSDDIDVAQAVTAMWLEGRIAAARRELHTDRVSRICCEECGDEIDERRRQVLAGVRLCVGCQEIAEHQTRVGHVTGGHDGH
ncbi:MULTISPECIES: TraR/DksA C4-type zinc finger protein [Photorhabdus]|uniref:TraR/DksA family transcriptional regulator n=2 Tax=Photorhabdus TaxID=29487 RepID=A0ABX0APQ8_9GAMM|nr:MULTISPECIES: TraR/DksA C4-type zinc finger protein [Photorhabdus]ERT12247.1 molecular chaperone DnaK [Photorhabdus temperata J3]NDK99408.1 TraR/DksA family transcriptional regulator [Photorhabdus bodei]NDL03736.1 TraR/DksA family transcriptional regulator [Photorhabdus bodei]NDL07787.1 TraR/DksA family transcriptional regulator [Photorhabdus bodei]